MPPSRPDGSPHRSTGTSAGPGRPRSPCPAAANGARAGPRPGPATVTGAHPGGHTVPPWPGGVVPGGRRGAGGRRRLTLAALVVALAAGVTAGVVIADGGHPAAQSPPRTQTHPPASPTATASAKRPPASPAAGPAPALSPARLTGTWTGTYFCPQGWTGLRLVLKAASNGTLAATFDFYPIDGDPGVPSGSFTLTGSYSARGFRLRPGHWISEPPNYLMVSLTAPAPGNNDTTLTGSVTGPGCTTFSVSR